MKWTRIILVVVALLALGAVCILVCCKREPSYQGRTLTEWIEDASAVVYSDADWAGSYTNNPKYKAASSAVQQIGTNAVPWLIKWMKTEESPAKRRMIIWINSHPIFHLHIHSASDRALETYVGFSLLGEKGKAAWPLFFQLTYDKNAKRRTLGLTYLMSAGPDKETLLPVLRRLSNDSDQQLRNLAIETVRQNYPNDMEPEGRRESGNNLGHGTNTNQSVTK